METRGIEALRPGWPDGPGYAVGSLKHDRNRHRGQDQGRSFEQAFEKGQGPKAGVASDDTGVDVTKDQVPDPMARRLQSQPPIIRKDAEDGEMHVDVLV